MPSATHPCTACRPAAPGALFWVPAAALLILLLTPDAQGHMRHGSSRSMHQRHNSDRPCLGCSTKASEQIHKELLLQLILTSLGMTTPPNVTEAERNSVPRHLLRKFEQDTQQALSAGAGYVKADPTGATRISKSYIFPERMSQCSSEHPSNCLQFRIHEDDSDLVSAEMAVYKTPGATRRHQGSHTLVLTALAGPEAGTLDHLSTNLEVADQSGWLNFDVTHIVQEWMAKGFSFTGVMIYCKTCSSTSSHRHVIADEGEFKPYLVIGKNQPNLLRRRSKRSSSRGCSVKSLTINFNQEPSFSFVLEPRQFTPNYCDGSCSEPHLATARHATVLQHYANSQSPVRNELLPCCSPTSYLPLSILYLNAEKQVTEETLPNMIAMSCGCR